MAFELKNDYSNSDANILAMQDSLDSTFFGKIDSITLTEFDSSTVPAIAAGSAVECNGALYKATTEIAISTTDPVTDSTVADGTVYALLVPTSGTASSSTTDTTGYATTTTEITLASAGTGTILVGDRVQFAGDSHTYEVTTGDADVSDGGSIVIASPGLLTAIAASATAITIYSGSLTSAFTATAPTWSDSKQGYYGTTDQANYRYIGGATKATASYSDKFIIKNTPLITDMKGINLTGNADISGDVSIGGDVSIVGDIDLTSNFQQFEQIKYYTGTLNASGTASFDSGLSDLENYIVLHAMFLFVDATYGKWINRGTLSTNLYLSTSTSSPNYILLTFDDAYAENADYRIVIAKIL